MWNFISAGQANGGVLNTQRKYETTFTKYELITNKLFKPCKPNMFGLKSMVNNSN